MCQDANRSFGNGAMRAGVSRPAIHVRPAAQGHARVNLAPSQPPLTLRRVHHQAPGALPLLPRRPLYPTTNSPSPRSRWGGFAAASSRRLSRLPRPLNQPEAPCHPAATWRAGEGGGVKTALGGARGPGGAMGGASPQLNVPTSEGLSGPGAVTVHWSRRLGKGGVNGSPAPAYLRSRIRLGS